MLQEFKKPMLALGSLIDAICSKNFKCSPLESRKTFCLPYLWVRIGIFNVHWGTIWCLQ